MNRTKKGPNSGRLYTTFELLREHEACTNRYRYLARKLGGVRAYGADTPIPLLKILEVSGLDDAEWALSAVPEEQQALRDRIARHIACDYAERVLPIFEEAVPGDSCPRDTIAVSRRFADGKASSEELAAAARAAYAWAAHVAGRYATARAAAARATTLASAAAAVLCAADAACAAAAWAAAATTADDGVGAVQAAAHAALTLAAVGARFAGRRDERSKQRDIFAGRLKEEWT